MAVDQVAVNQWRQEKGPHRDHPPDRCYLLSARDLRALFTLSLNRSEGLTVSLPASSTGEPRDPAGSVTVTVSVDGSLAWNKEQISLDDFLLRLQSYYRTGGDTARILINGDENAMFSQVRYVFDEARKIGFKKVFLETRIRQAGQ
jgi:biopolymer transport protein ExbD